MKVKKDNKKKIEYERIVKIVKDAEKAAEKFIQSNKSYSSSRQPKYL